MRAAVAILLLSSLFLSPVFAGEKEEIALRIQIVQEHIARLNEALYFIPYERQVYENALKELQGKQAELNKPSVEKSK